MYSAEKQFLKAMPKLMKAARNEGLKAALETRLHQSEGHVDRLEKIGELGGFKLSGVVCKAAQGLVEEAKEHLEEGQPGPVLDAAIVACAQKNEHYEIGTYGTILAWAKTLGEKEHVALLQEILAEEEATDKLLSGVASKEVNKAALSVAVPERVAQTKASVKLGAPETKEGPAASFATRPSSYEGWNSPPSGDSLRGIATDPSGPGAEPRVPSPRPAGAGTGNRR